MMDALCLVPDGKAPVTSVRLCWWFTMMRRNWRRLGRAVFATTDGNCKTRVCGMSDRQPNALHRFPSTNKPRTDPLSRPRLGNRSALATFRAGVCQPPNAHTFWRGAPKWIRPRMASSATPSAASGRCLPPAFATNSRCAVGRTLVSFSYERDRRKQNPSGSVNYWDVWYLGFELGAIADPKGAGPFFANSH